MKQKSFIALILTGLFLMNLTAVHIGGLLQLASNEEMSISNPFCLKSGFIKFGTASNLLDNTSSNQSLEIPAICNSVFDFKKASFSILFAEDNFKTYVFNDKIYSDLFSERFYIPPRV